MKRPTAVIAAPSLSDFYTTPQRISGLGERIVEKILQREGWYTRLILFPAMKKHRMALPQRLSYLEQYLLPEEFGPTAFFSRYHRFGPSPHECAAIILAEQPDAVFLSCFAFAYADDTLALAACLKEQHPSLPVYAGGAGVSVLPEYFTKDKGIDAVISGEAEVALPFFLSSKGKAGSRATDPSIDAQKIDFSIATVKSSPDRLWLATTLSRGCPRKCVFCANHLTQGRIFRTVSKHDFLSAVSKFPKEIPVHINFEDDNLLMDKDYFYAILEAISAEFAEASFSAENGMDYRLLDVETIDRLIDFGFKQFNLSMASSSATILKSVGRNSDLHLLQEILERLQRKNIPSITYFICGLKSDTDASVLDNIHFLAQHPTLLGISLFYPVPGLPDFKDPKIFNNADSHLCAGSSAYPWSGSLTTAQMITAFRLARYVNLSKKKQARAQEMDLLVKIQKSNRLYSWIRIGKKIRTVRPPGLDRLMEKEFFKLK